MLICHVRRKPIDFCELLFHPDVTMKKDAMSAFLKKNGKL